MTGTNRAYLVAGPGSRRIEDDSDAMQYAGPWNRSKGNFSGGTIAHCGSSGARLSCPYVAGQPHRLYLGTRYTFNGPTVSIAVDGQPARTENLLIPGEDVLVRIPLGQLGAGTHTVSVQHMGPEGSVFYFDFLELAVPASVLPTTAVDPKVTLATDWDTDHSLAIAPERTAWQIHTLGFGGRANHYVGALWFYELHRPGHQYASATVDFTGTPEFSQVTEIVIGRVGDPPEQHSVISHLNLIGDTAETIAKAFELELNKGYTAVWAAAQANRLTIYARAMGDEGNQITLSVRPNSGPFVLQPSGPTLAGGVNGDWRTDLSATPRLNRAVRDWSRSFYRALKNYGTPAAAAFSMELQHGDPSAEAGIAQRYPNGEPAWLNTPALQTNFSPESTAFWKQVYLEMAALFTEAGQEPFLQFGEVQWWYFPLSGSGMPFYDDYTRQSFRSQYGRDMSVVPSHTVDPASYKEETEFLPRLVGNFTAEVVNHVRSAYPNCRFEVLYPTDVNDTPFNRLINYPNASWTSNTLDCLKTESFTYTYTRNLDLSFSTVDHGKARGFLPSQRSFLVGIGDSSTAWLKEVRYALAEGVESVVLFALDQFCLIGYPVPLPAGMRRSVFQG